MFESWTEAFFVFYPFVVDRIPPELNRIILWTPATYFAYKTIKKYVAKVTVSLTEDKKKTLEDKYADLLK